MENVDGGLKPGTHLAGRYKIEKVLGVGGFGVTYSAHDQLLGRTVAIKEHVPPGSSRRDDGRVSVQAGADSSWGIERFLTESRRVAQLRHPSIVRVHDVLEELGTGYLVMEFLEGDTLEELVMQRGALTKECLLELVADLGSGLSYLHNDSGDSSRSTVLHLDVSPANIIMVRQAAEKFRPVLIDFGSSRSDARSDSGKYTRIVKDGYSPPELYDSRAPRTVATDVYSFAAVLFFASAGEAPPVFGQSSQALENLSRSRSDLSSHFVNVLRTSLELNPAERPQSISTMLPSLNRVEQREAQGHSDSARTRPAEKTRILPGDYHPDLTVKADVRPASNKGGLSSMFLVVLIFLVGIVGLLAYLLGQKGASTPAPLAIASVATSSSEPAPVATTPVTTVPTPLATVLSSPVPEIAPLQSSPPLAESPALDVSDTELDPSLGSVEQPQDNVDQAGRTPEEAIFRYYDLVNQGSYSEAWDVQSGEYRARDRSLSNFVSFWERKVSYVEVNRLGCDGQFGTAFCEGLVDFGLTAGGISRENNTFQMEIENGEWKIMRYRVTKSRRI